MLKKILPLLLVLLLCAAGTALADDEPTITITPLAGAYSMGSEVQMQFSVTGGAQPYLSVTTDWTVWCDYAWPSGMDGYGFGDLLNEQDWDPAAPAGTVSFQMADAYMVQLRVNVVDANGEFYYEDCDVEFINRTLQPAPYTATWSYSPTGVEVGQEITAAYALTGEYESLAYEWVSLVGDNQINHGEHPLSSPTGSLSFTPELGDGVRLDLIAYDERGVGICLYSSPAEVTGSDMTPVTLTAKPDVTQASPGDTVTVSYTVTGGSGKYREIFYYWGAWIDGDFEEQEYFNIDPAQTSGTITLTVPDENWSMCALYLYAFDDLNQMGSVISDHVSISSLKVTILADTHDIVAGQPLRAHYQVAGGTPPYDTIHAQWLDIVRYDSGTELYKVSGLRETIDTYDYTLQSDLIYPPTDGESVTLHVGVADSGHNYASAKWEFSRDDAPVIPLPYDISLSFSAESVAIGDELTVTYSLPEDAEDINYSWMPTQQAMPMPRDDHYPNQAQLADTSGTFSLIPTKGNGAILNLHFTIGNETVMIFSNYVKVTPESTAPLTLSCAQQSVQIGDTVTVHYKVRVPFSLLSYTFTPYLGESVNPALIESGDLTEAEGDIEYCVTAGDGLEVSIDIYYNDWLDTEPLTLTVTGDTAEPPTVTVSSDADTATVGVPITFSYEVTGGSGNYSLVRVTVMQQNDECVTHQTGDGTGTLTYLPTQAGFHIRPMVAAMDSEGWLSYGVGSELTVQPGTIDTLYLPAGLTEIGEAAFEGVAAQMVVIPNGCATIGPGAFADSEIRVVVIPASVTAIDDTAFDGLDEMLYLRDSSGANAEVQRIVDLLGCCSTTYMPYDIAQ